MIRKCIVCGKKYNPDYNNDRLDKLSTYCKDCIKKELKKYDDIQEKLLYRYNHTDSIEVKENPKFGYNYLHSYDEWYKIHLQHLR